MKIINKNLSHPGDKNGMWKGDNVSYAMLHAWVRRWKGKPNFCSRDLSHEAKRFEWANVSGKYLRNLNDYESLCPSCHRKKDYTVEQGRKMSIAQIKRWKTEKPSEALLKWRNRGSLVI